MDRLEELKKWFLREEEIWEILEKRANELENEFERGEIPKGIKQNIDGIRRCIPSPKERERKKEILKNLEGKGE